MSEKDAIERIIDLTEGMMDRLARTGENLEDVGRDDLIEDIDLALAGLQDLVDTLSSELSSLDEESSEEI